MTLGQADRKRQSSAPRAPTGPQPWVSGPHTIKSPKGTAYWQRWFLGWRMGFVAPLGARIFFRRVTQAAPAFAPDGFEWSGMAGWSDRVVVGLSPLAAMGDCLVDPLHGLRQRGAIEHAPIGTVATGDGVGLAG